MSEDSSSKIAQTNSGGPHAPASAEVQPIAKSKHKKLPWSPVSAVAYSVFLYLASQFAAAALLYAAVYMLGWESFRIQGWLEGDTLAQFLYILLAEIITIGGIVWFVRRRGGKMSQLGWNAFRIRYLWVALIGVGVYLLAYIAVAILVGILIPSINMEQEQNIGFNNVQGSTEQLLTFVSLVVLPPLAEEIVFRGFIFTSLRNRMRFVWAMAITSVLFAIPHLQFGDGAPPLWIAAIDTLVLSLVLCYVRERTGSLWAPILIHAIKNGIAFTALFLIH